MSLGLENRIALITGGAGHLGRHVVRRFLAVGARVHVPVLDENEAVQLTRFLGEEADAVQVHGEADLTGPGRVDEVVRAIEAATGSGPQILLNLAGGFGMGPIEETEPSTWERMWQINASTAFLCSRAVFPSMKDSRWGRIVNVAAIPALDRGKAGLSAYGPAKAAVLNLTYTLAKEGVGHGITANAILPSIIDTPANREAIPAGDTATWLPPEEIAGVLTFLCSEEARIVNGAAIPLTLG